MSKLAITKQLNLDVDTAITRVTEAIKEIGFGVLTRIDFDVKIKEKLQENMPKTVILGACNPRLAYEAYKQNTDALLLIPCNIVIRETGPSTSLIEAMRPTVMIEQLVQVKNTETILDAEKNLERVISTL